MRFLLYDLKRMYSSKMLVLQCVLSPIIVVMIFSTVVAPMIFTAKGLHYNLAICDEDQSDQVHEFITQMVNSQALADLVSVYPVASLEDGMSLLDSGDVSVLVHIPYGVFDSIRNGSDVEISIYSTKVHALEAELISMTLDSSLSAVGKSQNVLEATKQFLIKKGEIEEEVNVFLENSTSYAINEYMSRREAIGEGGTLSPMGEYLPVEYYLSAIFSLFAALAMLPLIHYSAADVSGAILRRGLLCGQGTLRFYSVRVISGTIFILLVQIMLFPTSMLLQNAGDILGGAYANNFAALAATMLLSSFCYSALAVAVAAFLPDEKTALWTGFFLALGMAVFCGALIPEGALPSWTAAIGKWLPMRASMRALAGALFDYNKDLFRQDIYKMIGFSALLLPVGYLGFRRRRHGA